MAKQAKKQAVINPGECVVIAAEIWINASLPIGHYHNELNSLVNQPGMRKKLHDEFGLILSAADTARISLITLIDSNLPKLAASGCAEVVQTIKEFAKREESREFYRQWPTIKAKLLSGKAVRPKNISGWGGKFIAFVNQYRNGELKHGDIRKFATKYLELNPSCKRTRDRLERAWRESQSGAKAAS